MADTKDGGRLKAELISLGKVQVPKEIVAGYRLSRSTAGPGVGSQSLALGWTDEDGKDHQIKLGIARVDDEAALKLHREHDGSLELQRTEGSTLLRNVRLLPIVMHAPGQAFINLDGECVHECAFCNTPMMDPRRKKQLSPERWVDLILEAHARNPFDALAITSVAAPDHDALLRRYEAIICGVLEHIPGMFVGVEPYVEDIQDIARLKDAGAHEIKINVQSPSEWVLGRICPGWSLERQFTLLGEAVRIFGRGKVTSNIIVGLGETDEEVSEGVHRMAALGVLPLCFRLRRRPLNRPRLEEALGHAMDPVSPERHMQLAHMLKDALERNGLTTESFETMCHKCGCCDLEPGTDV